MGILLIISILTVEHLSFTPLDVRVDDGRVSLTRGGCLGVDEGRPAIPGYIVHLKTTGTGEIRVTYKNPILLGESDIIPLQPPAILSESNPALVEPDRGVYGSNDEYPGKGVDRAKSGYVMGERFESILVYPIQYRPHDRVLTLYQEIEIEGDVSLIKGGIIQKEICKSLEGGYEYLIITNDYLAPYFEPLAEWKTQKGIPARIFTTQDIYTSFQGRDNQEKIREFIKSQNQDSGVVWVLLGGDSDIVPPRLAYAFECGADGHPDEDSIPCDLYYSDLDGDWDFDGDSVFGELEDSVDMMPDVFVGRTSVNSIPEAQNFIRKLLRYEKTPPEDYLTEALFFAMIMWDDPITDGAVHKDMIHREVIPSNINVSKLYESDGNGSSDTVIYSINQGKHLLNHTGHGWIDVIAMYPGWLRNWDMDGLINGDRLGILYSIGCWTGAFDYDCIAEHYVNSSSGGGVAYIGNSRYGWGSPGNPGYGYSEVFDTRFFRSVFVDSISNIGAALANSKAFYVPLCDGENVYRWCEYQSNLFGDPEMPIWTDTPVEVTVVHPDSIPSGEFLLSVIVLSPDMLPVKDARLTFKGDDYKRGWTSSSGEVALSINNSTPGYARITVTGRNIIPYEDSIYVFDNGAYLSLESHFTDNELNPGDTVGLLCCVANYGGTTSQELEIIIDTDDSLTTIIDGVDTLSQIPPSGRDTLKFIFSVSDDAQDGYLIGFQLPGVGQFNEMVKEPILRLKAVNKDGPVDTGDSGVVFLTFTNVGSGTLGETLVAVASLDSFLEFDSFEAYFDSLPPGNSVTAEFDFNVSLDCPSPHNCHCEVDYGEVDTFSVSIGCQGLSCNFENTDSWYSTGEWHLEEYRSYSPTHSFYCGDSITRQYGDSLCDSLISPPFYIDENSTLSFWHWFDMAGLEDYNDPGCDGLYVGVIDSSDFYLLDFIGSGGALDSAYNSCPYWLESTYDLSFISACREVRLLFRFISNGSIFGEGWYIDDVSVQPHYLSVDEEIEGITLFQNFPNPFVYLTHLPYRINGIGSIRIYDVSGRIVREFESLTDEDSPILWDGRDNENRMVPAGIYFYRLETEGLSLSKKILRLR